jgi:hypothetical protein
VAIMHVREQLGPKMRKMLMIRAKMGETKMHTEFWHRTHLKVAIWKPEEVAEH